MTQELHCRTRGGGVKKEDVKLITVTGHCQEVLLCNICPEASCGERKAVTSH